jgi:CheY-like chemotaxis protein
MQLGTIVLADDVPEIRFAVGEFLAPTGATILEASTGRQAMTLLRENACELLITDVLMPDMDGIELITLLRRANSSVPIVAISGGDGPFSADYCTRLAKILGAHAVLTKPFTPQQLMDAIQLARAG